MNKKVWVQIDPEAQKVVPVKATIPDVLFDGYAVFQALTDTQRQFTSPENVSAVLDAVVRLMRPMLSAAPTVPHLESADKVIHDTCQSLMQAVQVPQKSDPTPIGEIEARAKCEWTYDEVSEFYETSCGNAFLICDGTPEDNDMKFCPYCGGQLSAQKRAAAGEGK